MLELDDVDDELDELLDELDEELDEEVDEELDELEVEPPLFVPPQADRTALSSTTPVRCKVPPGHLRKIIFIETVPCLSLIRTRASLLPHACPHSVSLGG